MKAPGVDGLQSHVAVDSVPRDASAAALIASGLYELCTYITPEKGKRYKSIADKIVGNLGRHYQAEPGTHYGFLLLHSTGHHPGGERNRRAAELCRLFLSGSIGTQGSIG